MARCRPAPEGWGPWARWLRHSLLTDRSGYARRSCLASQPNSLQQNRKLFLHGPLVDLPAQVYVTEKEVRVELHRRTHLPILLASGLCDKPVEIPWWEGKRLRLTTYTGL